MRLAERARARELVDDLQQRLVERLQQAARARGEPASFERVVWLRDEGRHGGGVRYQAAPVPGGAFDRASVNVSGVHYDDLPDKRLDSATAFSSIVHPAHPRAPSVHLHVSWTCLRDGAGYWRVMADLNPCLPSDAQVDRFERALEQAAGELYDEAAEQGDKYFWIEALGRHRGASHFYLEGYDTGDWEDDRDLAADVTEAAIDTYGTLLEASPTEPIREEDRDKQLAYHTLYLFQVLTLDRGTTAGLLVHRDNDVGILGSLPSRVDPGLLASWGERLAAPQDSLARGIVDILGGPQEGSATVDEPIKRALADHLREHYRAHPEALAMQASGNLTSGTPPPTVDNHQ